MAQVGATGGSLHFDYLINGNKSVLNALGDQGQADPLDITVTVITEANSSTMGTGKADTAYGVLELTFTNTAAIASDTVYINPIFTVNTPGDEFELIKVSLTDGGSAIVYDAVKEGYPLAVVPAKVDTVNGTLKAYVTVGYTGTGYVPAESTATLQLNPFETINTNPIGGESDVVITYQYALLDSTVTSYNNSNDPITSVLHGQQFFYKTTISNNGNVDSTQTVFVQTIDTINLTYNTMQVSLTGDITKPDDWSTVVATESPVGTVTYTSGADIAAATGKYYFRIYVTVK